VRIKDEPSITLQPQWTVNPVSSDQFDLAPPGHMTVL
jgi:penicillin amidase